MGAVVSVGGSMISSVVSGIVMGLSWCFCTASMSLCTACCGNDKPSTSAPSISSGRKRSALLLLLSVGLALAFQYGVAPALGYEGNAITNLPKVGQYLVDTWTDGCRGDGNNSANLSADEVQALQVACRGNAGVYRVSGATFLVFILLSIAARCKPTFNREAWPAKYVLFLFLVVGTIFIPNTPLFVPIYVQLARILAAIFIVFQQIILIDVAYNWNESWVTKSDEAENQEAGTGKKWLFAILASCFILFGSAIAAVGLLFHYFGGCAVNNAFISLTLIFSVITTAIQLSGEEASLLTSAVIAAYSAFLCYSAVVRNPNGSCNPRLGDEDIFGIVVGIGLTLGSLAWTGYSVTAEKTLSRSDREISSEDISDTLVETRQKDAGEVQGVVMGSEDANNRYGSADNDATDTENNIAASSSSGDGAGTATTVASWKLNLVLALVCCWYAMVLTGWGTVEGKGNAANPQVSNVSMWMIIGAQWLCFVLYAWTMAAPRLFPDRDFS